MDRLPITLVSLTEKFFLIKKEKISSVFIALPDLRGFIRSFVNEGQAGELFEFNWRFRRIPFEIQALAHSRDKKNVKEQFQKGLSKIRENRRIKNG